MLVTPTHMWYLERAFKAPVSRATWLYHSYDSTLLVFRAGCKLGFIGHAAVPRQALRQLITSQAWPRLYFSRHQCALGGSRPMHLC